MMQDRLGYGLLCNAKPSLDTLLADVAASLWIGVQKGPG